MPNFGFPDVPNWLHWFLALATVSMLVAWVWSRYLSDRWAKRSQKAALRRMIRLAKNFKRICDLRRDVPALVALSARAIAYWIITIIILVTVVGILVTSMQLSDDLKQTLSLTNKAVFLFSLAISMLAYVSGFLIFVYAIFPLIDFKKYQKRTRERLTRLIDKSDWPPLLPEMPLDEYVQILIAEGDKTSSTEGQSK